MGGDEEADLKAKLQTDCEGLDKILEVGALKGKCNKNDKVKNMAKIKARDGGTEGVNKTIVKALQALLEHTADALLTARRAPFQV